MRWDEKTGTLQFSNGDLNVLDQCGMTFDEVMNRTEARPGLPPLWSLLSYQMMLNHGNGAPILWQEYRLMKELAAERDQHYFPGLMRKNTGGVRHLDIPDWSVCRHQQFIRRNILDRIPVSSCAFAYRKGVGLQDCARPHAGHEVLIHLDLKNFFSSITEEQVFHVLLEKTGYTKGLVGFITRMCCFCGKLPQGACSSPALSNICFTECDEALKTRADQLGLVYTRYSDDLYFSGAPEDVGEAMRQLCAVVERFGFRVNRDKTKVLYRHNAQQVLGLVVNEKVQVTRGYRRALRQELYYLRRFGVLADDAFQADDYLTYLRRLMGKVSYVLQIDPENEEFREYHKWLLRLIREEEYPECFMDGDQYFIEGF